MVSRGGGRGEEGVEAWRKGGEAWSEAWREDMCGGEGGTGYTEAATLSMLIETQTLTLTPDIRRPRPRNPIEACWYTRGGEPISLSEIAISEVGSREIAISEVGSVFLGGESSNPSWSVVGWVIGLVHAVGLTSDVRGRSRATDARAAVERLVDRLVQKLVEKRARAPLESLVCQLVSLAGSPSMVAATPAAATS